MIPPGGNRGVIARALELRAQGRTFALALVTDTEGSTYRKPGALALVADDGERTGAISGGCLEPALDRLACDALASGGVRVAVFDTRGDDDLVFGSGSGCRGRMRVLAWPVPAGAHALFGALESAQARGLPLEVAVVVDGDDAGRGSAWCGGERHPLADGIGDDDEAADLFAAAHGLHAHGDRTLARLAIAAAPRVLLLGAGPEAPALLRFARSLGWCAQVADHRPALLDPARLDGADRLDHARPATALAAPGLAPDAVLVMTHVAGTDLEALRALATTQVAYLGLLGPPGRRDELLAQLTADEQASLRHRLHAPVGLPLGGEGPEAIALAIAADLQRFFAGA